MHGSALTRLTTPDALNVSNETMMARANRRTQLSVAFRSHRLGIAVPEGQPWGVRHYDGHGCHYWAAVDNVAVPEPAGPFHSTSIRQVPAIDRLLLTE